MPHFYYTNDYKPIGGATYSAFAKQYTQSGGDITGQSLYNGNINTATYTIRNINHYNPVGYTYHYDQLNRIKKFRQHNSISTWNNSNINGGYSEDFTYDGNGNILNLRRSGDTSTVLDTLKYQYNRDDKGQLTNNKLNYLLGHGAATHMGTDQYLNNYKYDPIGNMIYDRQDSITNINWTVSNRISSMVDSGKSIIYIYGATDERVTKIADNLTTYYVRDGQGNTIAIYDNNSNQINWREQHLYGGNRLGIWQPNMNIVNNNANIIWDTIGHKQYELINHLGNIIITITDKRVSHTTFYTPDIATAQDYYAFGALMPSRTFISSGNYRYGFNGKENDNEVKGIGNQQDYGKRIYDPRVGRFYSTDPSSFDYPELSSYQFASNTPIWAVDLDGLEARKVTDNWPSVSWGGDGSAYDQGTAESRVRDVEKELYRTDPEHAAARIKQYNVNAFMVVGGMLTAGYGVYSLSTIGAKAFLQNMIANAVTGMVVNGTISKFKGESGQDFYKSLLSGFVGGAFLGANKFEGLGILAFNGAASGAMSEYVNQVFDSQMGKTNAYDMNAILYSSGIGAFANMSAGKIVNALGNIIDKKIADAILVTESPAYKTKLATAIKREFPSLGKKQVKKQLSRTLAIIRNLIYQQGNQAKTTVNQVINRAADAAQDKVKQKIKDSNDH